MKPQAALAVLVALLASSSASSVAHAEVTVQACSDAYTKGQEERLVGRLFSARAQFRSCDDSACPEAIVADCKRWTSEVEAELPSVFVTAANPRGDTIEGLSFTVDGTPIASDELTRPLVVDVGPHLFRFEAPGFEPLQLERSLKLEDRGLPINAMMQPVPAPTPAAPLALPAERVIQPVAPTRAPHKPFPVAAVTFASVGALALGGSLYFGLSAQHQYHQLQATCAPTCAEEKRQSVDNQALISDVALAASAAALGAAAWFYFSSNAGQTSAAVGLEPQSGGAAMRLHLTF